MVSECSGNEFASLFPMRATGHRDEQPPPMAVTGTTQPVGSGPDFDLVRPVMLLVCVLGEAYRVLETKDAPKGVEGMAMSSMLVTTLFHAGMRYASSK